MLSNIFVLYFSYLDFIGQKLENLFVAVIQMLVGHVGFNSESIFLVFPFFPSFFFPSDPHSFASFLLSFLIIRILPTVFHETPQHEGRRMRSGLWKSSSENTASKLTLTLRCPQAHPNDYLACLPEGPSAPIIAFMLISA